MSDQRKYRRLKRAELLELLIEESKKNDALTQEVADLKAALASRDLKLSTVGSIAEASLVLNGVFEAAQRAADEYLEQVRRLGEGERA
ncbi:MAG: hypothetical protein SOY67_08030 [Collinsella sp.]|nr:hypothetical protein [Collinsella sp.]